MPKNNEGIYLKTARELLDEVVERLNVHDWESRFLWDVLSALRGPDVMHYMRKDIKEVSTARIRAAIGLSAGPAWTSLPGTLNPMSRTDEQIAGDHFSKHYEQAVISIGRMGYRTKGVFGSYPIPNQDKVGT